MAVADTSVRFYTSTMSGAPAMSGTAGSRITALDGIRTGFGSVTLTSLAVSNTVATGTCNTGHGFTMIGGSSTGPVITIAGANPSSMNSNWRIASVADANHFTFVTANIADQTATGTITAKIAGLAMSKVYSGTNKAAYKFDDVTGLGHYLRVDDTNATYALLTMYETMSDVDTGTGASGNAYFVTSTAANGTAREWIVISDTKKFYAFIKNDGASYYGNMYFGDEIPASSTDAYHTSLNGMSSTAASSNTFLYFNNTTNTFMCRDQTQLGGYVSVQRKTHSVAGTSFGGGTLTYPNPGTNELVIAPVEIFNSAATHFRATMPGIYAQLHASTGLSQGMVVENCPQLQGHTLFLQATYTANYAVVDVTGPWR